MTRTSIPRLASEVSVSLIGVGSYLPDRRVSNEEILEYLRPVRPDGRPLEPEWVVKHLGIHERRLDYEFGGRRKRSRADGGLYDGDLALRASTCRPRRRRARRRRGRRHGPCDDHSRPHRLPGPLPVPCDRARIAPRRRPRPPQPRMRRAVLWISHRGVLARLDGTRHRAGGGEQLPVGLLRARGARLLLQAPERPGMAGSAHVR